MTALLTLSRSRTMRVILCAVILVTFVVALIWGVKADTALPLLSIALNGIALVLYLAERNDQRRRWRSRAPRDTV